VSTRSLTIVPGRRWSSWITRPTRRPTRTREERLELIERLSSEERRRLRSGEHVPDLGMDLRLR
jgi:hypothetical protein